MSDFRVRTCTLDEREVSAVLGSEVLLESEVLASRVYVPATTSVGPAALSRGSTTTPLTRCLCVMALSIAALGRVQGQC